jgi:hypothetical protein
MTLSVSDVIIEVVVARKVNDLPVCCFGVLPIAAIVSTLVSAELFLTHLNEISPQPVYFCSLELFRRLLRERWIGSCFLLLFLDSSLTRF